MICDRVDTGTKKRERTTHAESFRPNVMAMLSEGVEFIDLRFADLPGQVQHFAEFPADQFNELVRRVELSMGLPFGVFRRFKNRT